MASEIISQREIEVKEIPGWPGYRISNDGRPESCRLRNGTIGIGDQWRPLKLRLSGKGKRQKRYYVSMQDMDGKRHQVAVHKLVLITFVGPRPPGMVGCHNNGDATDNWVDNLRWDTPKANKADELLHGVRNLGARNGSAKLNPDRVREVRARLASGESQGSIARSMGISQAAVCNINTCKNWSCVN